MSLVRCLIIFLPILSEFLMKLFFNLHLWPKTFWCIPNLKSFEVACGL